jgi:hypothetical protein
LNSLLTFSGTAPTQNQPQQPKPHPSDWSQTYEAQDTTDYGEEL